MNLIIDQGNTSIKVALFHKGKILKKAVLQVATAGALQEFMGGYQVKRALISSVTDDQLARTLLPEPPFEVYSLAHDKPLPIRLAYDTPATLGLDRIALAVGAVYAYPAQDCLVIDTGTAITYDLVDRAGVYHGGGISPGLQMRYRALNSFTAQLPLVAHEKNISLVGKSTEASIRSGVWWGLYHEVMGIIEAYRQRYPQLIVLLTGGDAPLFDETSKNGIFAAPDFLLEGLNHILEYYADKT